MIDMIPVSVKRVIFPMSAHWHAKRIAKDMVDSWFAPMMNVCEMVDTFAKARAKKAV